VSQKNDTDVAHYNFSADQPTNYCWQRCRWECMLSNDDLSSRLL